MMATGREPVLDDVLQLAIHPDLALPILRQALQASRGLELMTELDSFFDRFRIGGQCASTSRRVPSPASPRLSKSSAWADQCSGALPGRCCSIPWRWVRTAGSSAEVRGGDHGITAADLSLESSVRRPGEAPSLTCRAVAAQRRSAANRSGTPSAG
jgi:hypothetical protein